MIGIVDIDIHQSTEALGERGDAASTRFDAWHRLVDEVLRAHDGELWNPAGDGVIYTFRKLQRAVDGCIELLEEMGSFNEKAVAQLEFPIYIRIGLAASADDGILNISEDRRGRHASHDVSRAGHLQKHCPVGSLAIASEVHQAIGIRAQMFMPSGCSRA